MFNVLVLRLLLIMVIIRTLLQIRVTSMINMIITMIITRGHGTWQELEALELLFVIVSITNNDTVLIVI